MERADTDPIAEAAAAMKLVEEAGGLNAALVPAEAETDMVDMSKHPSGIIPTLQNVVATVNLGCPLDLKEIALHARNAEYNPKRFAAVIMRIREPKTTALIFASGKMVCTGAKSEKDSKLAARKYCRIVQKLGFDAADFKEFKIQNIVGSCDVKFPIRLEGLAYSHGYFATYEPELFPGLIYRMKQPKIVLLIFVSGKVVLTGAKKRDEIYEAFENIYPTLQEFRKRDVAPGIDTLASQMLPPPPRAPTAANAAAGPSNAAAAAAGPSNGNGDDGAGSSSAAPRRAGSMLPPPDLPPATPAHVPPATPAYFPPSTPSYILPATPHHVPQELAAPRLPPATPRHPTQ